MTRTAYAKINLTLEVYGRRADGYHELRSIVAPIALGDEIELAKADEVTCDTGFADDLCIRAAKELGVGAKIHVEKRIPVGGGLGGGSADAAATLLGLNELYALGHDVAYLARLGSHVGSDVPALVWAQATGRPVWMEGRGERVRLLTTAECAQMDWLRASWLVLANPGVHSSTKDVYAHCETRTQPAEGFVNDLQPPACALYPEIAAALAALRENGATHVMMSGSGSTVFGFVATEDLARTCTNNLSERGYWTWSGAFAQRPKFLV